ncbi:excalibur calcium-binding domain-containing protein [Bacillus amyloliquefaciens]|uniref:excalibur calcium-binding domain-containing protein n=1 Tax=Bacillus amyloliquefaciens TaxID=1390 RepID=UPI00358DBDC3
MYLSRLKSQLQHTNPRHINRAQTVHIQVVQHQAALLTLHKPPPSTGGTEHFANCTELRKKYPHGVPSTHPAYTSKMDRDNDNFACEKN